MADDHPAYRRIDDSEVADLVEHGGYGTLYHLAASLRDSRRETNEAIAREDAEHEERQRLGRMVDSLNGTVDNLRRAKCEVESAWEGTHKNFAAEREMAAAARTKAARLEGIVAEKEREAEALREALETRMLGQCDHETRLIFHVAGDLRVDGNEAVVVSGPDKPFTMPPKFSGNECRYSGCGRELAGWSGRNQHERKTHGDLWTVGIDQRGPVGEGSG